MVAFLQDLAFVMICWCLLYGVSVEGLPLLKLRHGKRSGVAELVLAHYIECDQTVTADNRKPWNWTNEDIPEHFQVHQNQIITHHLDKPLQSIIPSASLSVGIPEGLSGIYLSRLQNIMEFHQEHSYFDHEVDKRKRAPI